MCRTLYEKSLIFENVISNAPIGGRPSVGGRFDHKGLPLCLDGEVWPIVMDSLTIFSLQIRD